MKKLLLSFVTLMLLIPSTLLAEQITVTVKGMVCSFCAQGIKKTLGKNPSVKEVQVDLDKKLVTIETHDGAGLKDEEIDKIINDAGYDVLKIERAQHA